ncbi:hypothetical protein Vafri_19251 [Volvox africanus]|uniref:Polycystin cation channel PKD1/PKD2 domain-containing protein n=1 Tax=Volvox africanus TaxID=51714 RepID=A0A8J4F970_9CHLO|nr:hypothetical protein Vafri_19251 [Volvox africanus]
MNGLDAAFTAVDDAHEDDYLQYKNTMLSYLTAIKNRSNEVLEWLGKQQGQDTVNEGLYGTVAALLEGSVASVSELADWIGLNTAMLVDALGLAEDQWFYEDFKKCLIQRSSGAIRFTFNLEHLVWTQQQIAQGFFAAPPPPPPNYVGYSMLAATQLGRVGRSLLSAGSRHGGSGTWFGLGSGSMAVQSARERRLQANSGASPSNGSKALFSGYSIASAAGKPPPGFNVGNDSSNDGRTRLAGVRGNRVVAGLLLHQVRRKLSQVVLRTTSEACETRFGSLRAECNRDSRYKSVGLADLGGIGEDPVCTRGTSLYSGDVAARPWTFYNFTEGNSEISATGMPFGFSHYDVPHMPDGYPIFFDTRLGLSRAKKMLTYVKEGNFLSELLSNQLLGRLLVYNADEKVFAYWRATFQWGHNGVIQLRQRLSVIPAIDYWETINDKSYKHFIPDWFMAVFVCLYGAFALLDVVRALQHQRQLQRAKDGEGLQHLTSEELYKRKRKAKRRWSLRVTPFWVFWELAVWSLMLTAMIILAWYVFYLSRRAPTDTTYDVYDAAYSPARFFMIRKDTTAWNEYLAGQLRILLMRSHSSPTNDTVGLAATALDTELPAMPGPGEDYRWLLPDDASELTALGNMYSYMDNMEFTWYVYFLIQAVVLLMLMVRLLTYLAFQPQLAIIGGTIVRAIPWLLYWLFITGVVFSMCLVLLTTCFGYRLADMATLGASAYALMRYIIVINRNSGSRATITEVLDMRPLERHRGEVMITGFVRALGPLFIVFILYTFLFTTLLWQQRRFRQQRRRAPTISKDFRNMFKWLWQWQIRHAPSNKSIDEIIDWITRPAVRYSWAYGMLYSAVVRSVAAMAGGAVMARRHPKQHKAMTERAILLPYTTLKTGVRRRMRWDEEFDTNSCPRYNLRALHDVLEAVLGVNKELRRELFFFFNTNVKDTRARRLKVLLQARARAAVSDSDASTMADNLARLLINRFGQRVPRRQARNYDDMMYKMKKRMGIGSLDGSEETLSASIEDSDDEVLPTGIRVGDLRHGGYGASAAATLHELQLQNAVQTAMRNVHHIRQNMGKELGDDPQLLATLFVAQFAGQIPEPQNRPIGSRPSLYRQRVQLGNVYGAGSASATPSRVASMKRPSLKSLPQPSAAAASGPVEAVTDTNTPEGMLTRALQVMLAPQAPPSAPAAASTAMEDADGAGAAGDDKSRPGRARPQGAKTRTRFAVDSQPEPPFGGGSSATAAASPSTADGGSAAARLVGSRTARSMLPHHSSQSFSRAISLNAPATLGTFGGLLGSRMSAVNAANPGQEYPGVTPTAAPAAPAAAHPSGASTTAAVSLAPPATAATTTTTTSTTPAAAAAGNNTSEVSIAAASAAASPSGSVSGAAQTTAPEAMVIRRPQIQKMRTMTMAAAAAARLHTLVSGAPGEITPATASSIAAASLASTPTGSMSRHRSGVATPRGDLVAEQINSLPLDRVVIFATATSVVQRLTSHVLQLLRELRGVQSDTDAMLRSTIAMIQRLTAGRKPFTRRAARMVPGVLISPAASPPVSPQTEKPPGWEDAAAARVAAANAALAAAAAAGGGSSASAAGSIGSGARLGSLRVRAPEEPEDMLPLPPRSTLGGADSYSSPRKLPALAVPSPGPLRPPVPSPLGTPVRLPPIGGTPSAGAGAGGAPLAPMPTQPVSVHEPLPLPPMKSPEEDVDADAPPSPTKMVFRPPPAPVDDIRPVEVQPEPITVVVHAKTPQTDTAPELPVGDAATQAAAALADQEADKAAREALAEEEGLPAPPPEPSLPPAAGPHAPSPLSSRQPSIVRPGSSTSQTLEPGMRLLTPPDAAHRRSGGLRTSSTPRAASPLLPTEAIVRLSPEPSAGSAAGSRPGTGQRPPGTPDMDVVPAREAVEEAGAQRNLPRQPAPRAQRASNLDGTVRRDEFGVEIMRLPETDIVAPEASELVEDEEGGSPHSSRIPTRQPSRIAFSEAATAEEEYDDDEDHPSGLSQRPAAPPPEPMGRNSNYVPPPSREPAAFSEPLIGTEPPSPARQARLANRASILMGLPPPPTGIPAPIRRRGLSRQASVAQPPALDSEENPNAAYGAAADVAAVPPPQVLTPETALQVINRALVPQTSQRPTLRPSPSRRVQLPPELERRQTQLARQQELLEAAQAAMAARRMSGIASPSRATSRTTSRAASPSRGTRGVSRGLGAATSRPGEQFGLPPPAPGTEPSNAVQLAEAALERRQQEEAANKAYVDELMERMRSGLTTTDERLALTGRLGSQRPPGTATATATAAGTPALRGGEGSDGGATIGLADLPSTSMGTRFTLGPMGRSAPQGGDPFVSSGGGGDGDGGMAIGLPRPKAAASPPPQPAASMSGPFLGPALAPIVPPPPLFNTSPNRRRLSSLVGDSASAAAPTAPAGQPRASTRDNFEVEDFEEMDVTVRRELPQPRRRQAGNE